MATTQGRTIAGMPGSTQKLVTAPALPDGTQFSAQWLQKMAMDGNMYTAHSGTGTAPNTFAGAYVNTTPDLDMSVAPGTMVVIVGAVVNFETYGTSLLAEVVMAAGVGGVIAPTSATSVIPVNHRMDKAGPAPGVTIVSDGTGATYMTSNVLEFYRNSPPMSITKSSASATVSSIDPYRFEFNALQTGIWPVLYNPGTICRANIFACSQAGTGFITCTFVVVPLAEAA